MIWLGIYLVIALAALLISWWPRPPRDWRNRATDFFMAFAWPLFLLILVVIMIMDPRQFIQSAGIMWGDRS